MIWNPFKKKDKPEAAASADAKAEAKKENKKESVEERLEKEFDKLPWFIKRQIKDPAVKAKFIEIAKRMEKDGVNLNDMKAVKKWMKAHEEELKRESAGQSHAPIVKSDEDRIGRNDPCPCQSGKKYKKCCGAGK
ncbi:SEC-C motif-containing protein [Parelusimicrobium proximum]|uniref:SEC-C metal-binding domain-containing protein n=1 Tax=Parelusimicrobium proximum TaxID=3228953 RepID=UPI003D17073D